MKTLSFCLLALLGFGCGSADLYEVGLDSLEVAEASMVLSADPETSTLTFSLGLRDPDGSDDLCPMLSSALDIIILADGEEIASEMVTRGGGDIEVDCAFRCRELVALAAQCTPVVVEMSGPDADLALNAAVLTIQLRQGDEVLSQNVPFEVREAREVEFPDGNIITLSPDEIVEAPGVGTTSLLWSHPGDESISASEWRSGERFQDERLSAFEFSPDSTEQPLQLKAVGLPVGEHTVFVSSRTPLGDCSFGSCNVRHVASAMVNIEHN